MSQKQAAVSVSVGGATRMLLLRKGMNVDHTVAVDMTSPQLHYIVLHMRHCKIRCAYQSLVVFDIEKPERAEMNLSGVFRWSDGRICKKDDVSHVQAFLASKSNSYVCSMPLQTALCTIHLKAPIRFLVTTVIWCLFIEFISDESGFVSTSSAVPFL